MTQIRFLRLMARSYVCSECGLEAGVFPDAEGFDVLRCPTHPHTFLDHRRWVEDNGHLYYRAEIEERLARKREPDLPKTKEEWEQAGRDLFR